MQRKPDSDYLARRAGEELELASAASSDEARKAHEGLAREFEKKLHADRRQPAEEVEPDEAGTGDKPRAT